MAQILCSIHIQMSEVKNIQYISTQRLEPTHSRPYILGGKDVQISIPIIL